MANLYVDPATGSDSNTYAQVAAGTHKWATIERAAWGSNTYGSPDTDEAAQAGDTVIISAGTYTVNSGDNGRWGVAYNPANSGTSGSPITFRGIGTVALRMSSNSRGPVIGANSRNYIIWDHFYIDDYYCGSHSDTGPVVFTGCQGSQIINSEIKGLGETENYANGDPAYTNNYNAIRLENATNCTISNNLIYNIGPGDGNENDAGIMTYTTEGIIVEHNEIHDCGAGINIKGYDYNTDNIIRYNNFYSCSHSGVYLFWYSDGTQVYQNIFRDCNYSGSSAGVALSYESATYHKDNKIVNNVFDGCSWGIRDPGSTTGSQSIMRNNIIVNCDAAWGSSGVSQPGAHTIENNAYYNNTYIWSDEGGGNRDFDYWTGTFGKDTVSPAGINQDPLFVDVTNHNYKLQVTSPAKSLGVDILDLDGDSSTTDNVDAGAYITGNETIGIEGASTSKRTLFRTSA